MEDISKIIKPIEGFQYSVNIAYDIYDDNKIKSYIPSSSSLHIIEDILASTENNSTDRARILTGPYGKGKSHLILYVLALLAGRDSSLFETGINKAKEVNINLAKNIEAYIASGKKLLPVIVNANSLDIKSTLLQSLNFALERADIKGIMPTTFFDVAIEKIVSWKNGFKETYKKFEDVIGVSGENFIDSLKQYDQSCYNLFVKIYPTLTSGSEFNPLVGSDVIAVYDSVSQAIKEYGYNGIFVVYDEFGKFLEGSVERSSAIDIKIIQDFAEKCNRSGARQLHIMLISHKRIDNYIGGLSKNKVDAWKAVSNRFKAITIENSEDEIYEMITTVLSRDEKKFSEYKEKYSEMFQSLQYVVDKDYAFSSIGCRNRLADKCYPLHPYTLLILPKISELIAQNERTIFTFLSSSEKFSVVYFMRTDTADFHLIEPDYIYDYFEVLFKGEPYGSDIKKQWQTTTAALSKLRDADNVLAEKIVKTIALIYIINDYEIMPPSWDLICEIYSIHYSWAEIESAKEVLKNNHLLIELLYKPYVRITEGSGHNVLEMIQQEKYKNESRFISKDLLNEILTDKFLYPVQYNDENEIIRYFEFRFIDYTDLNSIPQGLKLDTSADGIVFAILADSELNLQKAKEYVQNIDNKRAVFILPHECFDSFNIALELNAIQNLLNQYLGKELELVEELQYILEDRLNVLNAFIENFYFRFDKRLSSVYYEKTEYVLNRKSQLPHLLSQIAEKIYNKTPRIVNELINCNEISSPIKNARNKIISALLSNELKKDLGLLGNGPEMNIMRSMLITPGILVNTDTPYLVYNCKDERFSAILNEIRNIIIKATDSKGICFEEIYNVLINPEYGYGLKKGVIPIFLAVSFTQFKDHIIIVRKGREYALSAALLCDIENSPCDFSIILEEWDTDKDLYISQMESNFVQYINPNDRADGLFTYIVKAMRRWYLQLTKYEVTTKYYCDEQGNLNQLDKNTIRFRNSLSNSEINAHDFLFIQMPKIYNTTSLNETAQAIRKSYRCISSSYSNWHIKLIKEIKTLFDAVEGESLTSAIANFYDDLKTTTKEHFFSGKISMFLDIAKHPQNDEIKLVESIARALFNLRMSDFTDEIMNSYMECLRDVKADILAYDADVVANDSMVGNYKIIFTDDNGNTITKQFDSAPDSYEGQLLYNEITSSIQEYGEAISDEEKRQVLFKILKDLI